MIIQDYQPAELRFAYCYHAYLRSDTFRRQPCPPLAALDRTVLADLVAAYGINILECNSSQTEVLLLVSLKPEESISTCASKLKGRISRWLREAMRLENPANLLSKGYFACTSGKSRADEVSGYLDQQSEHHGYAKRALEPVFVKEYTPTVDQETKIQANHAFTRLQFHLVLATWRRRGVFSAAEGAAVAQQWLELQAGLQFVLLKVSFVPDHVHVAVRVHPSLAPAVLAAALMNSAQRVVFGDFQDEAIRAGVERLWQPSAYVGSFGDLASPQIQAYVRNWEADAAK